MATSLITADSPCVLFEEQRAQSYKSRSTDGTHPISPMGSDPRIILIGYGTGVTDSHTDPDFTV